MTPWNANKLPSTEELLNKSSVYGFLSITLVDGCWWSFPYGSVKNRGSVVRVRVLIKQWNNFLWRSLQSNETMIYIFPRARMDGSHWAEVD
jgi:hypothetical protein